MAPKESQTTAMTKKVVHGQHIHFFILYGGKNQKCSSDCKLNTQKTFIKCLTFIGVSVVNNNILYLTCIACYFYVITSHLQPKGTSA